MKGCIKTDGDYLEWYQNQATERDKKLHDRLGDFEDLFEDMLFEGGCVEEFINCEYNEKKDGSGSWIKQRIERPDELEYFTYNRYKTEVIKKANEKDETIAYYNHIDKVICITEEHIDKDNVLLHEMIHLHEEVLDNLPTFYRDSLLWALYVSLRKKVKNLDALISSHAVLAGGQVIYSMGGTHDILFLLKSIDLDIRMGYPLGTVFAYDSEEFFEGIE